MIRVLEESMDIDSPGGSKLEASVLRENGLNLYPVSANDSGEGLPYSPEDWPNPGDKWSWKTGRRISVTGHFLDRYLYLPKRLHEVGQKGFASKLSVKHYIKEKFPSTDVDAFFSTFSWKIPSKSFKQDNKAIIRSVEKTAEDPGYDAKISGVQCKAGNRSCSSLSAGEDSVSEVMFCDICCNEPGFCKDCCCILCCKTIDKSFYSHIQCEANIEGYKCGHHCHFDCALRAYMAGTVGGGINLDAEYYCRRCDSRTDLVSHVRGLLKNCETIDSRDTIEKILKVSICVLRGSKRTTAKQLLHHIELAVSKLKYGVDPEDIWKIEHIHVENTGLSSNANGASGSPNSKDSQDYDVGSPQPLASNFDYRVEFLKLEDKIDNILDALKKSQEVEYRFAEEKLLTQKNYILNLYQQLDRERCELSRQSSSKDRDSLLDVVLNRIDSIKREVTRLKDMAKVAKGFGRVPKCILKEHFGLDVED